MTIDPVSLAITAALTATNMALTMTQKIEGPRLDDLNVSVADYGTPLNYIYGKRRLQCPIIWAEPIKEKKKKRKTKGGKYNEYTYYGTWAVAVADHEIDAITRIWFDTRLVYDAGNAGSNTGPIGAIIGHITSVDDDLGAFAGNQSDPKQAASNHMRIYLGTETQEPDTRMLATVEAEHGEGSCPAYRGLAYIVFVDVPLEKCGNRIPQISAEGISSKTAAFPYVQRSTIIDPGDPFVFSPNFAYFMYRDGGDYELWDTATRTRMLQGTFNVGVGNTVGPDGTIYGLRSGGSPSHEFVTEYAPDGSAGVDLYETTDNFSRVLARQSVYDGVETLVVFPFSNAEYYAIVSTGGSGVEFATPGYQYQSAFSDLDGNIWLVGAYKSAATVIFHRIHGYYGDLPDHFEVAGMPTSASGTITAQSAFHYRDAEIDRFIVSWGGDDYLVSVDLETQTVAASLNISVDGGETPHIENVPPGAKTFWIGADEFDSKALTLIRQYGTSDFFDWVVESTPQEPFYDPINHAIVTYPAGSTDQLTWRFLDRVDSNGVTLASIVSDVATRSGIDPADIDATDLDQIIYGWSWTSGSGKAIIEPLLDLYDSDARPHDFQIEFLKRTGIEQDTLDVSEFLKGEPRYSIVKAQDTDLPRKITLSFADIDGEQQPNSVVVQRPLDSTDSKRETPYDLTTLVLNVDEARNLAERYFRRAWNSRESYSLGLLAKRAALEPADVWNLGLDDVTRTARLAKLTFSADDSLKTEWIQDNAYLGTLSTTTGAPQDGRIESSILIPLPSRAIILDIPLIHDHDNDTNPSLYYGAAPYGTTGMWGGATLYQSDGGDYSIEFASVGSGMDTTWGYSTTTLADATAAVWDRGNSVTVRLNRGDLTSSTEAACNQNPNLNLALLGNELIQFATATLNGDGTYTLSVLKRGRRGTEWATAGHASNEAFTLLDTVGNKEMGASDIGDSLSFKALSMGRDVEGAIPSTLTYAANSHKPYSPVHLKATKATDATISWRRRSRIGGRWTGGTTVPLGEDSESYEIDIYSGVTFKRTLSASSESVTYTAADMATDGTGSGFTAKIYQISALVDRGNEASATFAF